MSAPTLEKFTKCYGQDGDGCNDDHQYIEIEMCDAGGGPYYVIKTERWAFDKPEEIVELLRRALYQSEEPAGITGA